MKASPSLKPLASFCLRYCSNTKWRISSIKPIAFISPALIVCSGKPNRDIKLCGRLQHSPEGTRTPAKVPHKELATAGNVSGRRALLQGKFNENFSTLSSMNTSKSTYFARNAKSKSLKRKVKK
jgi:hypothetical protein